MALTDAQIDRFSRQIILPEIGGRGQERLLRSSIALAGEGEMAASAARYLAGAGIGRIGLHGSAQGLEDALLALSSDTRVERFSGELGSVPAGVLVACDLAPPALDRAANTAGPLAAAGSTAHGGWLVVRRTREACPGCAARAVEASGDPARPLRSSTAGVLGSLISLEVVKLLLDLGDASRSGRWQFDAARSILREQAPDRAPDCPVCAAG